ncbi:Glycosyltransferase [Gaiella occulta]|uniref:Glycosyltransferase n=1 Tax=Gaiella occulta TaxID=1002870 RepID=A0A7M2YW25_9ACTN|nr:glycosyltransferase family 4 protein [Gaiella occulta]RDI74286.1 Glycosyltransferase [Gaiella occulta]
MKRRLLMVGRTRYALPLDGSLARKFDALSAELDVRVLAARARGAGAHDPRFRLYGPVAPGKLEGAAFWLLLPFRVARELRATRPDAVLSQGGHETALVLLGRALARVPAKVVMDVHGDPGAATRLYGSRARAALAPLGDLLTRLALRRADAVRTISPYTTGLVRERGVEAAATFPAFMDLDPFLAAPAQPPPQPPTALFVGVLERYKAVDVLADAWRVVAERVPRARLRIVGRGSMAAAVEELVAELPGSVEWTPRLSTPQVAAALDDATVLVLPSRSEGLGRVVIEAFCRGRGVVASRVGGIPDLVEDGVSGLLVEPGDADALADAIVRALTEAGLAERLGKAARLAADPWLASPQEYARRVRRLVDDVVEGR